MLLTIIPPSWPPWTERKATSTKHLITWGPIPLPSTCLPQTTPLKSLPPHHPLGPQPSHMLHTTLPATLPPLVNSTKMPWFSILQNLHHINQPLLIGVNSMLHWHKQSNGSCCIAKGKIFSLYSVPTPMINPQLPVSLTDPPADTLDNPSNNSTYPLLPPTSVPWTSHPHPGYGPPACYDTTTLLFITEGLFTTHLQYILVHNLPHSHSSHNSATWTHSTDNNNSMISILYSYCPFGLLCCCCIDRP